MDKHVNILAFTMAREFSIYRWLCMPLLFSITLFISATQAEAKILVVATIPALAQIAEAVGDEDIEVSTLVHVGQNPHLFVPRSGDIRKVMECSLIFSVGYGFESSWLKGLIRHAKNSEIMPGTRGYFTGADAIEAAIPLASVTTNIPDSAYADKNPHWWLDPRISAQVAMGLSIRLSLIDPFNASRYFERAKAFIARVAEEMPKWQELMQIRAGPVMTYQDTYAYFMHAMDIEPAGNIEPKLGIEPSTRHMTALVRRIKQMKVQLIWVEPYNSRGIASRLADVADIRMMVVKTSDEGYGAEGYIGMIDGMVQRISRWSR